MSAEPSLATRSQRIAYIEGRLKALDQEQARYRNIWIGSAREAEERLRIQETRKARLLALMEKPGTPEYQRSAERFELANEGLDDIESIKADYVRGKIDIDTLEDRVGRALAVLDDA